MRKTVCSQSLYANFKVKMDTIDVHDRKWYRSKSSGRLERTVSSGMSEAYLTMLEDSVFLNEEWLRNCSKNLGQVIIVDSGCPRSLMGNEELDKLKQTVDVEEIPVKN